MAPKHYDNIKDGSLFDYLTCDKVRTILPSQRDMPLGISEIALEIQLKKKSASMLSFKVPWDGVIYGCVRGKRELKEKLGLKSTLLSAAISDWDGHFVLIFETVDAKEAAAFNIDGEDVIRLLEGCMRVPQQQSEK